MTIIPYIQNTKKGDSPISQKDQFISRVILVETACRKISDAPYFWKLKSFDSKDLSTSDLTFYIAANGYFLSSAAGDGILEGLLSGRSVFAENGEVTEIAVYYLDKTKKWMEK
jgi:hypothetical protein